MAADVAPTQAILDKWEMEEQWVTVKAEAMRTLTGETDGRPWSLITFPATEVKEVSPRSASNYRMPARPPRRGRKRHAREAKADRAAAKAAAKPGDKSTGKPAA